MPVSHHVKKMLEELISQIDARACIEGMTSRFETLHEELEIAIPEDFEPAVRFDYVEARRRVRLYRTFTQEDWTTMQTASDCSDKQRNRMVQLMKRVEMPLSASAQGAQLSFDFFNYTKSILSAAAKLFDSYVGEASLTVSRKFPFIRDSGLREIVERDYRELATRLFPSECWKSIVILSGSILEALLHDLLTRDAARVAMAMAAKNAPEKTVGGKKVKRDLASSQYEDQWHLKSYINVAEELGLIPADWKNSVHAVLRDFRNFVHPRLELQAPAKISDGDAYQSVGALMKICDHIEANHK